MATDQEIEGYVPGSETAPPAAAVKSKSRSKSRSNSKDGSKVKSRKKARKKSSSSSTAPAGAAPGYEYEADEEAALHLRSSHRSSSPRKILRSAPQPNPMAEGIVVPKSVLLRDAIPLLSDPSSLRSQSLRKKSSRPSGRSRAGRTSAAAGAAGEAALSSMAATTSTPEEGEASYLARAFFRRHSSKLTLK